MTQAIKQTRGLHRGCDNGWRDIGESEMLELLQESGIWSALCTHTADLPTLLKTSPDSHPCNAEFLPIQRELAQPTQTGSFTFISQMEAKRKTCSFTFSRQPKSGCYSNCKTTILPSDSQPHSLGQRATHQPVPTAVKGAGEEASMCTNCW